MNNITTIGALKASGYIYKSIKDEIRSNLIKKLQNKEKAFKILETGKNIIKNDPQNHYYYAVMQNDAGKSKEAITTILNALKKYPNNEQLLTLAYSIYTDRGEKKEANNILLTLKRIFPSNKQYQQINN